MNKRILGIDLARALAIIGMIIVNFKTVLGHQGGASLNSLVAVLDGKAAATFVVLAGLGMGLLSKKAYQNQDHKQLHQIQIRLFKRALFLWLLGLLFYLIWPADILHYYAIYILITSLFLKASNRAIWSCILFLILSYPLLLDTWILYDQGWDFNTLEYLDFWTLKGFFRNLFFNGFHPVVPWVAFMLCGLWLGRQDLNQTRFLHKVLWSSCLVFAGVQLLSFISIEWAHQYLQLPKEELILYLGTAPMPPLPYYMISGGSMALIIICLCIFASNWIKESLFLEVCVYTGQLALTFYVAHVVLGLFIILSIFPQTIGTYSIYFSVGAALIFNSFCLLFAYFWRKKFALGPLELLMRKIA